MVKVSGALADRLERTVVVVSSKSGSTVETDSQRRAYVEAFRSAGIDPTRRIVVVTDPGSPLDGQARADGYRVVNADPEVGGRYSALTAFGLVPSGLAGVDVQELLDDADAVADLLADDDEGNPALRLGAAMAGTDPLRDKLVLVDDGSGLPGFGDWADIDIVLRRSTDGGKTWEPMTVLADSGTETVNNPVALPGAKPNEIHFLYCVNYARAYHRRSLDGGKTFSAPVEITSAFLAITSCRRVSTETSGRGFSRKVCDKTTSPCGLTICTSSQFGRVLTIEFR